MPGTNYNCFIKLFMDGGGGGGSITNIFNIYNVTNIIEESEDEEESNDKDQNEETQSQEYTKPKEKGLVCYYDWLFCVSEKEKAKG